MAGQWEDVVRPLPDIVSSPSLLRQGCSDWWSKGWGFVWGDMTCLREGSR